MPQQLHKPRQYDRAREHEHRIVCRPPVYHGVSARRQRTDHRQVQNDRPCRRRPEPPVHLQHPTDQRHQAYQRHVRQHLDKNLCLKKNVKIGLMKKIYKTYNNCMMIW